MYHITNFFFYVNLVFVAHRCFVRGKNIYTNDCVYKKLTAMELNFDFVYRDEIPPIIYKLARVDEKKKQIYKLEKFG